MKKKMFGFLVSFLAVLMLLSIIAPAFAAPPTWGTCTQVIVQADVSPGKAFMVRDVLHVSGSTAESYLYGADWGDSTDGIAVTKDMKLNFTNGIGNCIVQTMDSFDAGIVEGIVNVKFIGWGFYTYNGPTFSFEVGGISGTVTTGDTYVGILLTAFAVKHGISGDLKGLQTMETSTGLWVYGGPLNGVTLVENTITYKPLG